MLARYFLAARCAIRGFCKGLCSGSAGKLPCTISADETDLFFRPLFAFFIIQRKIAAGDPRRSDTISDRSFLHDPPAPSDGWEVRGSDMPTAGR